MFLLNFQSRGTYRLITCNQRGREHNIQNTIIRFIFNKSNGLLTCCTILVLVAASMDCQENTNLSIKPAVLSPGRAAKVKWNCRGESAFLSALGSVNLTGSLTIRPETSTEYILVCEGKNDIAYRSVRIKVIGERGESLFPDPENFPDGLHGSEKSLRYTPFLNLVFKTLQDKLKFRVRAAHLPFDQFYLFYTDKQIRPNLISSSDQGIRSRRLAVAVRVEEPRTGSNDINFELKVVIDYQRRNEYSWYPEKDQQIVQTALSQLRNNFDIDINRSK